MNLLLLGLNHKTAPVEVRECLAPPPDAAPQRLREALDLPGVREVLLISTCNRVEVLVAAEDEADLVPAIKQWLAQGQTLDPALLDKSLYLFRDEDAVRHLFRVASSLDSLVLGEPQILGQIKEAFRLAAATGTTRTVINRLMHKTFSVAKRVRSETRIGGAAVSVSYAAVELARKIFDDLARLKALLVGAGEMAELAAEHLLAHGIAEVMVANRTYANAVDLAARLARGGRQGKAFSLDDLPQVLSMVDIVISSTGATETVITVEMARKALKQRRGRPLFFIDIAVPRDVDARVGDLDGCFVFDIDDLGQVVQANRASRAAEAGVAESIVAEEVVKFASWLDSLEVAPTIAELTAKAERLRQAELSRTMKDLGEMAPEQAEAVDRLTRSLVKKLLNHPILFLKDQSHGGAETQRAHTALLRRIFRLGPENPDNED